MIYTTEILPPR